MGYGEEYGDDRVDVTSDVCGKSMREDGYNRYEASEIVVCVIRQAGGRVEQQHRQITDRTEQMQA